MLAEVIGLIGCEDLKLDLAHSRWKRCLPLKLTRFAGISQIEFL
jgi:hypothetical protein